MGIKLPDLPVKTRILQKVHENKQDYWQDNGNPNPKNPCYNYNA